MRTLFLVLTTFLLALGISACTGIQMAAPTAASMMGSNIMNNNMSMAQMGAKMDQMTAQMNTKMATTPVSGTMPISLSNVGMMMQIMGIMQQHVGQTQMMMGAIISDTMMGSNMMGSNMMNNNMSMAEMGAKMDQMTAQMNTMMAATPVSGTMPMSSTMSIGDIWMMMQMMGMMQQHIGQTQMMMGAVISDTMMGSNMMGNKSGMHIPSDVPFDAMFIDSMIVHHQRAIDMANMALQQAEHEELRTLSQNITAAQTTEIKQMQGWRSQWYPALAATGGLDMGMGEMAISEDASKPFDQRFLEAMISHHQGAIDMAKKALKQADHEEIRTLAGAIITAQKAEIEQMQGWLSDWYGISQ